MKPIKSVVLTDLGKKQLKETTMLFISGQVGTDAMGDQLIR